MSRGLVVEGGPQHRARQALRAAERLGRVVVEGLAEGVVVTDPDLRAISWNDSALQILRLAPHEFEQLRSPFLARGVRHLDADGNDLGDESALAAEAQRTGERCRAVIRRVFADGSERYLRVSARPLDALPGERPGVVCTFADVTSAVVSERELREERDRAQRYLDVASTIVVVLDIRGRVELINGQGCALLGVEEDELLGQDWFSAVIPAADRLDARMAFARIVSETAPPADSLETFVTTKAGEYRKIAWRHALVRDEHGVVCGVMRSGEDVTARREAEAQVTYLAYHDGLTGLPNRTMLQEHLARELARARRSGAHVALLYFDLDDFKLVNDSLGHAAGDAVLVETAKRVAGIARAGDLLARLGGDEFLLMLQGVAEEEVAETAAQVAARITEVIEAPLAVSEAEFHVGASIGIAVYPRHATDAEALLKRADSAMYQAKEAGGRTSAFYEEPQMDSLRRLSLTARLRRAAAADELRLHYQPIVHDDGRLYGAEALVRWEDPERGLIPPGEFIPVAEDTGLIDTIGDWVVNELCDQAARWQAQGFVPPLLSFNLSPRQLRRRTLAQSISDQVAAHGLAPERFCVEVTESAVLTDAHRHRSLLEELREAGFSIAIDDFGAGHSSLSRLRALPVDVLKVDRSFLDGVPGDHGARAIVSAILHLSEAYGTRTVVEGVETAEQMAFLRDAGRPLLQGFLLGRPMPADQLLAYRCPDTRTAGPAC